MASRDPDLTSNRQTARLGTAGGLFPERSVFGFQLRDPLERARQSLVGAAPASRRGGRLASCSRHLQLQATSMTSAQVPL